MAILNLEENLLLDTDSYKAGHYLQYPPGTDSMFSYIESRGGKYSHTVFFGLQYILKRYLSKPITVEMVEEAKDFFEEHGEPFNYEGWMYIAKDLNGKLPIRIRALPEGSIVPTHNMLVSVESTDPKAFWVVSYLETMLLRIWYPITVATQSNTIRSTIAKYLNETSTNPLNEELAFKLHDFGSRGVSSSESAGIGGLAHLVNFFGSDTVQGVVYGNRYYNSKMAGYSIPASEHSSITSWGKSREVEAYRNMLKQFAKPGALVACVSDSYDLFNACENLWGEELKAEIINSGATLVVRPDSGDPATVVLKTLQILDSKFGSTVDAKGFKVLNHVRVIQGDGCLTQYINRPLYVPIPAEPSYDVYSHMSKFVQEHVKRQPQDVSTFPSCTVMEFDWWDIHTGVIATKKGWRYLIRVCESDYYEPRNDLREIIRLQSQVYSPHDFGW